MKGARKKERRRRKKTVIRGDHLQDKVGRCILSALKSWLQLILAKYDINGNYSSYIKATSTKLAIIIVRPSVNKLQHFVPSDDGPTKPETLDDRNRRLAQEIREALLEGLGNHSDMFKRERVIVDVPLLLKTFNSGCTHLSCPGTSKVLHSKMSGGVLTVSWECSEGHLGCWRSSNVLCQKNGQDVYTNSMLMAAGIFISGNSYDKLSPFNEVIGLGFISKTTFNRVQTHFVIREVM